MFIENIQAKFLEINSYFHDFLAHWSVLKKKSVSYLFVYIFVTVMLRFANGLMVNDPLQTLYQYMTGRQPNAVKECADANWGDWRPHLAMILSNAGAKKSNELDKRSILTLGETLTEKGWFC